MFGPTQPPPNFNNHRFLDHNYVGAQDGKNVTARAPTTPEGYCIEYRETLEEHAYRLGRELGKNPRPVSNLQIGITRGLNIYGYFRQAKKGDNTEEKPSFIDVMGVMKWNAYEAQRGKPKDLMYKLIIIAITAIMKENGLERLLVNEDRPGPDYYKDCIKFNWVEALKTKHKTYLEKIGDKSFYTVKLSAEEEALLKEMNASVLTTTAAAVAGLSLYTFVV